MLKEFLSAVVDMLCVFIYLSVGNFGMEWEVATLKTRTPYKAYTGVELEDASVGMKLGLRGVNITLYGEWVLWLPQLCGTTNNTAHTGSGHVGQSSSS